MTSLPGDLLLHPVRLRIIQALVGRPMTATELKNLLGDVAQATLYRHIGHLAAGGLIEVIEERRIRGGVERTYQVVEQAVQLSQQDFADTDPEQHFRYFATFVATLLNDFASYLQSAGGARQSADGESAPATSSPNLEADGVGYRQVPLWLSDDEFAELAAELSRAVQSRRRNSPGGGRRRRLVTSIVMPDDRQPQEPGGG